MKKNTLLETPTNDKTWSPLQNQYKTPHEEPLHTDDNNFELNQILPYPWVQYYTEDGYLYYYNPVSGESTWEFPVIAHSHPLTNGIGFNSSSTSKNPLVIESPMMMDSISFQYSPSELEFTPRSLSFTPRDKLSLNLPSYSPENKDEEYGTPLQHQMSFDESSISLSKLINSSPIDPFTTLDAISENILPTANSSPLSNKYNRNVSLSPDCISVASSSNANIDCRNKSGQSVLHISASMCMLEGLSLLLSTGAEPNSIDNLQLTPLAILCQQTPSQIQLDCMKLLLAYGANVNCVDSYGNSLLHILLMSGTGCDLLSQQPLSVSQRYGQSIPMEISAFRLQGVDMLLECDIDLSIANSDGDQALHIAAKLGLIPCMQAIVNGQLKHASKHSITHHSNTSSGSTEMHSKSDSVSVAMKGHHDSHHSSSSSFGAHKATLEQTQQLDNPTSNKYMKASRKQSVKKSHSNTLVSPDKAYPQYGNANVDVSSHPSFHHTIGNSYLSSSSSDDRSAHIDYSRISRVSKGSEHLSSSMRANNAFSSNIPNSLDAQFVNAFEGTQVNASMNKASPTSHRRYREEKAKYLARNAKKSTSLSPRVKSYHDQQSHFVSHGDRNVGSASNHSDIDDSEGSANDENDDSSFFDRKDTSHERLQKSLIVASFPKEWGFGVNSIDVESHQTELDQTDNGHTIVGINIHPKAKNESKSKNDDSEGIENTIVVVVSDDVNNTHFEEFNNKRMRIEDLHETSPSVQAKAQAQEFVLENRDIVGVDEQKKRVSVLDVSLVNEVNMKLRDNVNSESIPSSHVLQLLQDVEAREIADEACDNDMNTSELKDKIEQEVEHVITMSPPLRCRPLPASSRYVSIQRVLESVIFPSCNKESVQQDEHSPVPVGLWIDRSAYGDEEVHVDISIIDTNVNESNNNSNANILEDDNSHLLNSRVSYDNDVQQHYGYEDSINDSNFRGSKSNASASLTTLIERGNEQNSIADNIYNPNIDIAPNYLASNINKLHIADDNSIPQVVIEDSSPNNQQYTRHSDQPSYSDNSVNNPVFTTKEIAEEELAEGWVEYCTEEGDKYYYNVTTEMVQWKKPIKATTSSIKSTPISYAQPENVYRRESKAPNVVQFAGVSKSDSNGKLSNREQDRPATKKSAHTYTKSVSSSEYEASRALTAVLPLSNASGTVNRPKISYVSKYEPPVTMESVIRSKQFDNIDNAYNSAPTDKTQKPSSPSRTKRKQVIEANRYQPEERVNTGPSTPKRETTIDTSFSTPLNDTLPTIRTNMTRNPSISSLSGSESDNASRERTMEVWNRFFENAIIAKMNSGDAGMGPSKSVGGFTPRGSKKNITAWKAPTATADYRSLVEMALTSEMEPGIYEIGSKALLEASARGDVEVAEELLLRGFNPSCVDDQIRTPLHYASRIGHQIMVVLLSDYGSDVDAADLEGRTALHVACALGHVHVVQSLVQYAANIATVDQMGNTPLHISASGGYTDLCQILLEYGSSITRRNINGETPYDLAKKGLYESNSQNTLGYRRCIAQLSTADSKEFNSSPLSQKERSQILANATADEDYSLPSDSVVDDDMHSIGSSSTRQFSLYQRSTTAHREESNDEYEDNSSSKNKARKKTNKNSSNYANIKKSKSKKYTMLISEEQSPIGGLVSPNVPNFYDPRRVVSKTDEWIERGKKALIQAPPGSPSAHLPPTHIGAKLTVDTKPLSIPKKEAPIIASHMSDDNHEDFGDDEEDVPATSSYRGLGAVWGAASSLIGATMKIFSSSAASDNDSMEGASSTHSWTNSVAPPTDAELLNAGLGFHFTGDVVPMSPKLPSIVADELQAQVDAYKSGVTPRRAHMQVPDEVIVAVEMARAAERHRQTPRSQHQAHSLTYTGTKPFPLTVSVPRESEESRMPPTTHKIPPSSNINSNSVNKYSMGSSIPAGVKWRYVDVLGQTDNSTFQGKSSV